MLHGTSPINFKEEITSQFRIKKIKLTSVDKQAGFNRKHLMDKQTKAWKNRTMQGNTVPSPQEQPTYPDKLDR